MNEDMRGRIFSLFLFIPAFVAALTVHEFAHAWAGNRLGDDTARRQGRLTLDPVAHLDPFGCLIMVYAVLSNLPLMGWARPVPFDPRNLRNPRRDGMLIALAGPISNLLQVPIWLFALWIFQLFAKRSDPNFLSATVEGLFRGTPDTSSIASVFAIMLATGVIVNISLAAFNMIPIPPLDGHYVLEALGPPAVTDLFNAIRPWSFLILYALLFTGVINTILDPVGHLAYRIVFFGLGLHGMI
jgi:Zn-dependent protease